MGKETEKIVNIYLNEFIERNITVLYLLLDKI